MCVVSCAVSDAKSNVCRARTSFVDMGLVQSMRAELELEPEQDFLVVLAVAERLSPGIYATLVGNPAALEDKFIELFESF